MNSKYQALLWLRVQQIKTNPSYLLQLLMPLGMALLYTKIWEGGEIPPMMVLMFVLPFAFTIGTTVLETMIIAEDHEKQTLRALSLAGVGVKDYLSASLSWVFVLVMVNLVLVAVISNNTTYLSDWRYWMVGLVTVLSLMGIAIMIGLLAKKITVAQVYSSGTAMLFSFLPMFAAMNESLRSFVRWTPMGLFVEYFLAEDSFQFFSLELGVVIAWALVLMYGCYWAYRRVWQRR